MNLKVKLFEGFELNSPLWIASSHLTESPHILGRWKYISPSAITLKTSSNKGGEGEGGRLMRNIGKSGTYYCDGNKKKELLDYDTTEKLLKIAKKLLPNSKIGCSILMGEEYNKCLDRFKDSDYFEFNLKYSVRSQIQKGIQSKFTFDQSVFGQIKKEITSFLDAFSNYPCFIKFTREIDWLGDYEEFRDIMKLLESYPRVGIILANTKKWVVPSSASGLAADLEGGVIAGRGLFEETYNIIKKVKPCTPPSIPIIATGGIDSLRSIIDMFKVGAKAIQLCTVFHIRGMQYYNRLTAGIEDIRLQLRTNTFQDLYENLQHTAVVYIPSLFSYHPNFYSYNSFAEIFKRNNLDILLVYGRTFTRINQDNFVSRFKIDGAVTRIIMMASNSPCLKATAYSLDRDMKDMRTLIKEMSEEWIKIYHTQGNRNHRLEIYQHKKIPFHSGYITEFSAFFVPYSLTGESPALPIYEFSAETFEYIRLKKEFNDLLKKSDKIFISNKRYLK